VSFLGLAVIVISAIALGIPQRKPAITAANATLKLGAPPPPRTMILKTSVLRCAKRPSGPSGCASGRRLLRCDA